MALGTRLKIASTFFTASHLPQSMETNSDDKGATRACTGIGLCLSQDDETGFYSTLPNANCKFLCKALPCPNVQLCNTYFPDWLMDCSDGRCLTCDIYFGQNLIIRPMTAGDDVCPVCLESDVDLVVVEPACGKHIRCVPCFRMCWFGPMPPDPSDPRPPFPYPDRWEEYQRAEDGPDGPVGFAGDPVFEAWNDEDCEWEDRQQPDRSLQKCPLCTKMHVPGWVTWKPQ